MSNVILDVEPNSVNPEFPKSLNKNELDALKYALSLVSIESLEDGFSVSAEAKKRNLFYEPLRMLAKLHAFSHLVPAYGILYRGRPKFINDHLVEELRNEAEGFRKMAVPLAKHESAQDYYQPDTGNDGSVAERLSSSKELLDLVQSFAGPSTVSPVVTYIYYDRNGQCSLPHVDNAFTAITVMVGLRHDCKDGIHSSCSVSYWPDRERLDYRLQPGEVSIFFGVSALHGRTPVSVGETVHSLLLSFVPEGFVYSSKAVTVGTESIQ